MSSDPISRRDFVAQTAVAAGALTVGLLAQEAVAAAQQPPEAPTLKPAKLANVFPLSRTDPQVKRSAGSVALCTRENFPVVTGNQAAIYYLKLAPGAIREPHWHPNCWEMNFVVQGKARLGVANPDDTFTETEMQPGDAGFIPMGVAHYIQNIGSEELVMTVCFNSDQPQDIGLSTMFAGLRSSMTSATLGVSPEALAGFNKPHRTEFIVPGKPG